MTNSKVTHIEDRFMHVYRNGCITNELDEVVNVRLVDSDHTSWEPTDKGKLILAGEYESTHRARTLKQIDEQFVKKKMLERQQKQAQLRAQQQEELAMASRIGTGARNVSD